MILALAFMLFSDSPPWWDYPGFELWKFFNLGLFVALMIFVLMRANIKEAFRTRGETIKSELEKARNERDAALAKLKEVEERLAGMQDQVASINQRAKNEAREEQKRVAQSTKDEVAKLTAQAQREIENAAKTAKHDLQIFAAEQSVRMAADLIKQDMRADDDARLMMRGVEEMGARR